MLLLREVRDSGLLDVEHVAAHKIILFVSFLPQNLLLFLGSLLFLEVSLQLLLLIELIFNTSIVLTEIPLSGTILIFVFSEIAKFLKLLHLPEIILLQEGVKVRQVGKHVLQTFFHAPNKHIVRVEFVHENLFVLCQLLKH